MAEKNKIKSRFWPIVWQCVKQNKRLTVAIVVVVAYLCVFLGFQCHGKKHHQEKQKTEISKTQKGDKE